MFLSIHFLRLQSLKFHRSTYFFVHAQPFYVHVLVKDMRLFELIVFGQTLKKYHWINFSYDYEAKAKEASFNC